MTYVLMVMKSGKTKVLAEGEIKRICQSFSEAHGFVSAKGTITSGGKVPEGIVLHVS